MTFRRGKTAEDRRHWPLRWYHLCDATRRGYERVSDRSRVVVPRRGRFRAVDTLDLQLRNSAKFFEVQAGLLIGNFQWNCVLLQLACPLPGKNCQNRGKLNQATHHS